MEIHDIAGYLRRWVKVYERKENGKVRERENYKYNYRHSAVQLERKVLIASTIYNLQFTSNFKQTYF